MSSTTPAAPAIETLEGEYAGFITRFAAFFIDILIINLSVILTTGIIVLVFGFFEQLTRLLPWVTDARSQDIGAVIAGIVAVVVMTAMTWLYPIIFWMVNGQTIGKRIMGLRVVRMNGEPMSFWRGLLRVFGYWIAALPLFLGFIWVIFSNNRRGWHDMLAGTCVIYSWDARASQAMRARADQVRALRQAGKKP